ncbi:MAG: hypothetical protein JWO75_1106, partial [Actinomycetia bacterium]|nr:hypothetical protein [Actinomycetes bacterium]
AAGGKVPAAALVAATDSVTIAVDVASRR